MSLSSLIWGQSQFDEAVDKATSELRLAEGDIALNLEICDQIRSKAVPPKDATRALRRRLNHKNPNVQLLALGLTDVCVKNGGDHLLVEVASKEFMDNLVSILRMPNLNIDVRNKMLRFIQNWSIAFEGKYTLGYVGQVYRDLSSQGFKFPPKDLAVANSAMVDTSTAPEWIDSDVCLRCRTAFSFTNRKHHCRNCGQVFDQQCSSKSLPLPHFGITQEVRVCDGCYAKLSKNKRDKERTHSADFYSSHHRHSSSSRSHKHRSAREFTDTDLQRAIQLSLEESRATSSNRASQSYQPSYNQWQISEPPLVDHRTRPTSNGHKREDDDPELKAAIEASLREANAPKPSAPVVASYEREEYAASTYNRESEYSPPPQPPLPTIPNHDLHPQESDAIMTFNQTVEDVHARGGRDLSRFSNVHEMYDRANGLRPKLALSLDDTGRKEQMLSEMHDKLSQAVKIYDHLLTEQLSHPTWRTASTSHQPVVHAPSRYHTVDGSRRPESAQWPQQQYVSSPVPVEQGYQTLSYGTAAAPSSHVKNPLPVQRQVSYSGNEYASPNQYAQPQPPPQPLDAYPQHYSQQPVSVQSDPSQYESQQQPWPQATNPQQQYQPPAPVHEYPSQYQSYHPPEPNQQPGQVYNPPGQSEYRQPQPQPHPQSQLPSTSPEVPQQPPTTHYPIVQPPVPPVAQSPAPASQLQYIPLAVQSPPPAQQHQSYHQPSPPSTLARHNTVGHSSYASPPPVSSLGRSNTVAYSHPQPQQTYAPAPTAPSPLPAFPTAPTSNPQVFPMYGPGLQTSGLEQTEKEVALIDL